MDKQEVKEILAKQLQLLSEKSEDALSEELPALTNAMVKIMKQLLKMDDCGAFADMKGTAERKNDPAAKGEQLQKRLESGKSTINDIRAEFGLNEMSDGNQPIRKDLVRSSSHHRTISVNERK